MARDLDEDFIEATIRRVAASKAARPPDADGDGAPDEPAPAPDLHVVPPQDDLIEATIRRVAASKAARLPDVVGESPLTEADAAPNLHLMPPVDQGEDLIEATIRRVAASKAARLPDASTDRTPDEADPAPDQSIATVVEDAHDAPKTERPPADESLIEATLRRIETQQAARGAEREDGTPASANAALEHHPTPDLHLVERVPDDPEMGSGTATSARSLSDIVALRRDLDDARLKLRELTERVDAMVLLQPEQPPRSREQSVPTDAPGAPPSKTSDDDWEDSPRITRMDVGLPPRPPIIRDASPPETAAAPVNAPEPSLSTTPARVAPQIDVTKPKRGFDLLPRTYRITVEDKRRGVDLVPLHRALLGMDGVRDMSLLSYSNGTAIVSLEATAEIAADALGAAVARAMAREVKVEVHNEQTMVIKLAED